MSRIRGRAPPTVLLSGTIVILPRHFHPSIDNWISELAGLSGLARWVLPVGKMMGLK